MVFANGNKYDGEFKEGRYDGKGVFTWANGDYYDGDWVLD